MSDLCLLSNYSAKIIKIFIIIVSILNKCLLFPIFAEIDIGTVFETIG